MLSKFCPACGAPFDDDGDRIIADECMECGWATPYRRQRNKENAEKFARVRAQQHEQQEEKEEN